MANAEYPMTAGSGITIRPNGRVSIGCEASFPKASPANGANQAFKSIAIPAGYSQLEIWGGDAKLTPYNNSLAEALFRLHLLPNGLVTDDLSGPELSVVIAAKNQQPVTTPIQACIIPLEPGDNFLAIEFQEASGASTYDMELQITGVLT